MAGRVSYFYENNPIVTSDRQIMAVGYKYKSQKVLGFIDTQESRSTVSGVSYLSYYPDNY